MSELQKLVDGYFTMWNETDETKRLKVIQTIWSDDAVSVDPMVKVVGHGEIGTMVENFQGNYPGHKFAQRGDLTEHHDRLQFYWRMVDPDGVVKLSGQDCVRLSDDGRIQDLAGFFDATPV